MYRVLIDNFNYDITNNIMSYCVDEKSDRQMVDRSNLFKIIVTDVIDRCKFNEDRTCLIRSYRKHKYVPNILKRIKSYNPSFIEFTKKTLHIGKLEQYQRSIYDHVRVIGTINSELLNYYMYIRQYVNITKESFIETVRKRLISLTYNDIYKLSENYNYGSFRDDAVIVNILPIELFTKSSI